MIIVASLILGAVFLLSGVTKIASPLQWRSQAAGIGVPPRVTTFVPFVELALGALLIAQIVRRPAAVAAGLLLSAFTALLVLRLSQGRRPPCACFGVLSTKPISWANVARNLVFLALAAVIALS